MNTIDSANAVQVVNNGIPALTRKIDNKTFEVYVHFSTTSKETMMDKIIRLVRNDIRFADMK